MLHFDDAATMFQVIRRRPPRRTLPQTARSFLALVAAAMLAITGCQQRHEMASVTGIVVFRGEPLRFGNVMFQHKAGGQPAEGVIQADGTFRLSTFLPGATRPIDGARVGSHLVRITCFEGNAPNSATALPNGERTLGKSLIPRKYGSFGGSGLTREVEPDTGVPQHFSFDLQ